MAFSAPSVSSIPPFKHHYSSPLIKTQNHPHFILPGTLSPRRRFNFQPLIVVAMAANTSSEVGDVNISDSEKPTRLITFLGKGGSGKTTSAVFAAQHFAMAGLKTCLVIHSQDPTAEYLLNCKIGTSPVTCNNNLSAVRLETTKMLLEPLSRLKQADARLNMNQGVLEGVVGEELGVLPGMDSIFSVLALESIVGFFGNIDQRKNQNGKFDIVIYDGISSEETLRMIGAASKARLYLKYLRNLAERTDLGRLAGPTALRLVDESLKLGGRGSLLSEATSGEIWDSLEQILESGTSFLAEPRTLGCYLVMDPNSPTSLSCALRYWGGAIQAGAQVSGAFGIASPSCWEESTEMIKNNFSPLPCALFPHLLAGAVVVEWNETLQNHYSKDARNLLTLTYNKSGIASPVIFDSAKKSITLFMPGFDKSEIKLYQYRGGSELLVDAGDQRRVIRLPSQIQGKVGGAKFIDRSLVITMR